MKYVSFHTLRDVDEALRAARKEGHSIDYAIELISVILREFEKGPVDGTVARVSEGCLPTLANPFSEYARCEETTGMVGADYIRCGAPAEMVILSERGRRLYFMCRFCGTHNVDNRDTVLIMRKSDVAT